MIKGVITDLDGVIFDSMHIWDDLGSRYLASKGIRDCGNTDSILCSMNMNESCGYLHSHYLHGIPQSVIRDELETMLFSFYRDEVMLKPGAYELLEFLAANGIRTAAATTCPGKHAAAALKRTGTDRYIPEIFTSEETGCDKNNPGIYNSAADFTGTEPCETLVIEDSLYAVRTAASAGYITCGVYDAASAAYSDEIRSICDIYTENPAEIKEKWPEIRQLRKK